LYNFVANLFRKLDKFQRDHWSLMEDTARNYKKHFCLFSSGHRVICVSMRIVGHHFRLSWLFILSK